MESYGDYTVDTTHKIGVRAYAGEICIIPFHRAHPDAHWRFFPASVIVVDEPIMTVRIARTRAEQIARRQQTGN